MARIPVYEGGISTRPIHQQGVQGQADERAFGGGAGLMSLGAGLGRFAAVMGQARDLEDMTRAKDAENEYARYMQERMYGENGYMLSQGRHAFEGRGSFMDEAEKKRLEIGANLPKGAQKHYHESSTARLLNVNQQVLIHAGTQQKEWVKNSSNARAGLFAQDALNSVGNQPQVNRNIAAGLLEIREQAKLEGIPADVLAVKEKAYVSGVHHNVVLRLAQQDPLAAADYMEKVGEQLSPEDRYGLETKLEGAILEAKGKRNGLDILTRGGEGGYARTGNVKTRGGEGGYARTGNVKTRGGQPVEAGGESGARANGAVGDVSLVDMKPDERGTFDYMKVAQKFLGSHEVRDGAALSEFIKRSSGISIDPKTTAWCAAFVNAVLGASGLQGTGKLNARSFLQFGTPTSQPQVGDIVVLSRGDPKGWQGHVGFFQGYDDNGNVLVLGGNQGNKVSVAPYKAEKVLGFRQAGRVDEATRQLPNYELRGLGEIEKGLQAIADPAEREATRSFIEKQLSAQRQAIHEARDQTIEWLDEQLALDPQMDLSRLPLEMQAQIGLSGMNKLRDYQTKALERGGVKTDEIIYDELHTHYISDPAGFGELDLNDYRDKLSDEDWKEVRGWRKKAKEGNNKYVRQEVTLLSKAMNMAGEQLDAAGLATVGKKGDELKKIAGKRAAFKRELGEHLKEFKARNNRDPDELEVEEMVNRLLLPIVIRKPGMIWDSTQEGFLFEGRMRGDGTSVEPKIDYEAIPYELRKAIQNNLVAELGRQPTREEIYQRYFEWRTDVGLDEVMGDGEGMSSDAGTPDEREGEERKLEGGAGAIDEVDPALLDQRPTPAWSMRFG